MALWRSVRVLPSGFRITEYLPLNLKPEGRLKLPIQGVYNCDIKDPSLLESRLYESSLVKTYRLHVTEIITNNLHALLSEGLRRFCARGLRVLWVSSFVLEVILPNALCQFQAASKNNILPAHLEHLLALCKDRPARPGPTH